MITRNVLATLELVRTDAAEGGTLTVARFEAWQRRVLAVATAPFRTTSAWARAGRERYAYRDVLHFHPFADGNARSAALALYFVLAREGVVLDRAAPLLMTRLPASGPRGAEGLARFIAALVEQTRR